MRIAVGVLICLSGLTTVWASEPPRAATPPAAPTDQQAAPASEQSKPTAADATPTATASAPAAAETTNKAASATSKTPELTADEKNLLSHGYKLEIRDGKRLFCHSEAQIGTRFTTKTCRSAEQIAATRQNSKDYLNDVQRPSGNQPGK